MYFLGKFPIVSHCCWIDSYQSYLVRSGLLFYEHFIQFYGFYEKSMVYVYHGAVS